MTTITADVSAIIESHAAETRSNREIAKPVIDALKECGFFKMMLPKKWGWQRKYTAGIFCRANGHCRSRYERRMGLRNYLCALLSISHDG